MSLKVNITSAISSHFMWKVHLKKAIDMGKSDYNVETVKKDNVCDFGKWLYSIQSTYKDDHNYKSILALHSQFHLVAAEVLDLATKGNQTQAKEKLNLPTSEYRAISQKLTLEMAAWRDKL